MEEESQEGGKRWANMQESIDLLFAQVTTMDKSQQQLLAQMEITAKAVHQSTQDQLLLAKQLAVTSEAVNRITQSKGHDDSSTPEVLFGGRFRDPGQPSSFSIPQFGHHKVDDEVIPKILW